MKDYPKHYAPEPNEWVPHKPNMEWQCCDCGLVYNVTFRLIDEKTGKIRKNFVGFMLAVKMTRNKTETKKARTKTL